MAAPLYKSMACTVPVRDPASARLNHCRQCANKAARLDFFVTTLKTLFSIVMGSLSGSAGLHAVGLQGLGDIIAKGSSWVSIMVSHKHPTRKFPYGYGKVQFLSALLIGGMLFTGSLMFILHNYRHVYDGNAEPPNNIAIIAALVLALVGEWMYRKLECVGRENNNPTIMAAAVDNRADGASALLVLVGALMSFWGWPVADNMAALIIAILVVRVGAEIAWDAITGLLDIGLPSQQLMTIQEAALLTPGVRGIKRLRGRRLGDSYEVDLSLYTFPHLTMEQAEAVRDDLKWQLYNKLTHLESVHISFTPLKRRQQQGDDSSATADDLAENLPDPPGTESMGKEPVDGAAAASPLPSACPEGSDPSACLTCTSMAAKECLFSAPDADLKGLSDRERITLMNRTERGTPQRSLLEEAEAVPLGMPRKTAPMMKRAREQKANMAEKSIPDLTGDDDELLS